MRTGAQGGQQALNDNYQGEHASITLGRDIHQGRRQCLLTGFKAMGVFMSGGVMKR